MVPHYIADDITPTSPWTQTEAHPSPNRIHSPGDPEADNPLSARTPRLVEPSSRSYATP